MPFTSGLAIFVFKWRWSYQTLNKSVGCTLILASL